MPRRCSFVDAALFCVSWLMPRCGLLVIASGLFVIVSVEICLLCCSSLLLSLCNCYFVYAHCCFFLSVLLSLLFSVVLSSLSFVSKGFGCLCQC